ncbi:hypothetical protein GCM10010289_26850 [Streptomyces violascens]|uniref:Integral membrane protein n=1 Tax=Streptomyces violascens TaxID=67381 RepID=A0ABQ3QHS5_9ACTN|nr:hypothetical protein GCM10010289_26850 [Streptomyces violascens]GHI36789.1 hypothetical protein Sviol_11970 [Streptomyces violascens]
MLLRRLGLLRLPRDGAAPPLPPVRVQGGPRAPRPGDDVGPHAGPGPGVRTGQGAGPRASEGTGPRTGETRRAPWGEPGENGVRFVALDERLPLPEARRALRGWRRTRPFWAGLFLVLGGLELLVVPLSPLTILVSLGLGGIAAIGIGLALVAAGLFLWFLPHTRHYVSINALILSVLSFAATNLGGFLVGMALGITGSAMGFGWTPKEEATRRVPNVRTQRTLAAALPLALLATLGGHRVEQAPRPGSVTAPAVPPTVTTTRFSPNGFLLAGVTTVPTAHGSLKVMILKMNSASLTDYRLITRDGHDELALGASSLDLSGHVTLYLTKFSGCLEGLLCITFDPNTLPVPPIVPPFVFMTDVTAEQALVTSDSIVANGLTLGAS